ncbi:serine hydrolase domain-containing protein [Legionella spiritensis]|uniref:serine hydrolase domain-containing protein n=1 Tax=Legionella spiritensis TaxID=452 RepID=UPI000F702E42|nr:serine hydrolase domain-containing protein [Legionella spiritensis]VEG91125.1 penicillin-binding protein AmpH [Legionella spiritensis]
MKILLHVLTALSLYLISQSLIAATPLVEFISRPESSQFMKPQNSSLLFYTLRNNTGTAFPLSVSFSSNGASVSSAGNTCGNAIAGHSTCVLTIQYQAPANDTTDRLVINVYYQGRAPLVDAVTFNVDSNIACVLLNTASYQTPFCQQQYQNVIQFTPNVFNVTNQNVTPEQTLGGVFGIYQNHNNGEQICYISCGLRALNGTAPNENTLFELASVTKTLTTSILGKLLYNGTIGSAYDAIAPFLPAGYMLGVNESPVTFQQLATFSGGVCFSDAPSVNQSSTNQALNQANFVMDINGLNPDPASGPCSNGQANTTPEYTTPPYLPTHNFYSNSSIGLLGQGLMNIDGFGVLEPGFNDWMCKNVFNVLGMTQSNACLPGDARDGTCGAATSACTYTANWTTAEYASGYHLNQGTYQPGNPFPFLPWAPAGGIRSNAVDMVKFIRANLGFNTGNTPEQLQLIQGMMLAHQPNDYLPAPGSPKLNIGSQSPIRGGQGYAWVCMPSAIGGDRICGKIGGHKNFRSFLGLNINQHYGVIILFNTGAGSTNGSFNPATAPPTVGQIGTNLLEHINKYQAP